MAYMLDEAKGPSGFVKEPIPQEFMASYSPRSLFTPLPTDRWPTDEWVVDKARKVALVAGGTNGNFAADEGIPSTQWWTLFVDGLPVCLMFHFSIEYIDGSDPVTNSRHSIEKLKRLHVYLPPALFGRKEEVVALAEEAMYVEARGLFRSWIRGVVAEVEGCHLGSEYGKVKHHGI